MSIGRLILPLVAALWLWPVAVQAQSEALMEADNQANALYHQGRYGEAIPFARKALELGEREFGPDHPTTDTLLNNLAELYREQGRYAEAELLLKQAEPLLKRALAIDEKAMGPDHPSVATGLNNLAELYRAQGRYAEAEPLFKRALAIYEKALGPDHPRLATSLENYAALLRKTGRGTEATEMEARAKAIRAKHAEDNTTK